MRPSLYAIFGVGVGALYGYLASLVVGGGAVATGLLTLIGSGFVGFFGYLVGSEAEDTRWRRVVLVLLLPAIPMAAATAIIVLLFGLVLAWPVLAVQDLVARRRFRVAMQSKGRYIPWHELQPKLENGEGTLLDESGPRGRFRIWYTEDDVLDKGVPVSSDEEYCAVAWGECSHVFNSRCIREYLDNDEGRGLLTSIGPGGLRRIRARYPQVPVATLVRSALPET